MYMDKTPTKAIRKPEPGQYGEHQDTEPNSDREEEGHVRTGEPGVFHAPSIGSESEAEQPCPNVTQAGPCLTPDTDEQILRRSTREKRPAALFTYHILDHPSRQVHSSVSSAEVYETPDMALWGMQPYPLTIYPIAVLYNITSAYLPHPCTLSVFHNRPIYTH